VNPLLFAANKRVRLVEFSYGSMSTDWFLLTGGRVVLAMETAEDYDLTLLGTLEGMQAEVCKEGIVVFFIS
jgi:hypothetical protein